MSDFELVMILLAGVTALLGVVIVVGWDEPPPPEYRKPEYPFDA